MLTSISLNKKTVNKEKNVNENKKCISHNYKVNDSVLVTNERSTKYGQNAYSGPWTILEVRNNGTVKIEKKIITDIYNIQNITTYVTS